MLERRISAERLAPYRAWADGDASLAISLYANSSAASGQLWVVLGHMEVLVRNALHEELSEWSRRRTGDPRWYLDPLRVFHEKTTADVMLARSRVLRSGKVETSGRVVAELTFGFWRYLLAKRYERSLWRECLYRAFPGQGKRKVVHAKLAALHELRNRIAHHESIYGRPLPELYNDALTVAGWICPTTRDWIQRQSLVFTVTDGNEVSLSSRKAEAAAPGSEPASGNSKEEIAQGR
ncbi:MAG TPA: hypothetical protein VHU91_02915 [Mycobacteriales bacterium]|nr:hypothetical protein [Mycobacteriales bacterium]